MKSRFATIAMTVIVALIISTLATISSARTSKHHSNSVTATQGPAEAHPEPLPQPLTPVRAKFRVRHVFYRNITKLHRADPKGTETQKRPYPTLGGFSYVQKQTIVQRAVTVFVFGNVMPEDIATTSKSDLTGRP